MHRFALFGFLPITFTSSGTWRADTGCSLTDVVADAAARVALVAVSVVEQMMDVEIPVRLTPLEPAEREQISA